MGLKDYVVGVIRLEPLGKKLVVLLFCKSRRDLYKPRRDLYKPRRDLKVMTCLG